MSRLPLPTRTGRDLAGLVVVITGGARGIGAATAERFAAAGASVALGDRDADLVRRTAADLDARFPAATVVGGALDVTDRASWDGFLAEVAHLGPVDVLVNNAGVMPLGPALEEDDEVTRTILDVNVVGVIHGTKAVGQAMVARGTGQIVNVASAVGRVAAAGGATYSASKFAVVGYTEATRAELRPRGVEVGCVLPTVVLTELSAGVGAPRGVKPVTADDVAGVIEEMVRRPKPEMWVPRWSQGLAKGTQMLPKAAQDAMAKALGADHVLSDADPAARAAYEARARDAHGAVAPAQESAPAVAD